MENREIEIKQQSNQAQPSQFLNDSKKAVPETDWDKTPPKPHFFRHKLYIGLVLLFLFIFSLGVWYNFKSKSIVVDNAVAVHNFKTHEEVLKSLGITDEKTQASAYALSVAKKHLKIPLPEVLASSTINSASMPTDLKDFVSNYIKPDAVTGYLKLNFAGNLEGFEIDLKKNLVNTQQAIIWDIDINDKKIKVVNTLRVGRGTGIGEFSYTGKYIYVLYHELDNTDASTVGQIIFVLK